MKKIAIANRGEVACRIIKSCKKLGYKSLLLHSKPDELSQAYREADERFCIGEGPASESYLNAQKIVDACVKLKADALHPGFGFLSENSEFAQLCLDHKILFIGPTPENISTFGNKNKAKELCTKAGVPTLPYFFSKKQDLSEFKKEALKIKYPVLIKALHGGGGRGMRVVRTPDEFQDRFDSAKKESLSCFGDDQVFIEKYLESPKHIEVQIFGDSESKVWALGERECSVQRRHQKIIEEAPSASISKEQRGHLMKLSTSLAQTANYKNAGTVEYLFDQNQFYFLEMNTRLQVEHPVTELIYNIDLVSAQIKTAFNEKLTWHEDQIIPCGHAIESRICAETAEGLPSIGELKEFYYSGTERFDSGFKTHDVISSFYDSMIAKLIVHGTDREQALLKMQEELTKISFGGIELNLYLLHQILNHADFKDASMTTHFMNDFKLKKRKEDLELGASELSYVRPVNTSQEVSPFGGHSPLNSNYFLDKNQNSIPIYARFEKNENESQNKNQILSPLPGKVLKIYKSEGDAVEKGETLILLEAMKMEHQLKAGQHGEILKLNVKENQDVPINFKLLSLK